MNIRWVSLSSCLLFWGGLWGGMLGNLSEARAEVRSIQEFMVFKDKWDKFVATEYVWQLEGRYSGISDDTLTFMNCPLPFRLSSDLANNRDNSSVVEVTGTIVQEEKGLAFRVKKLEARPRDMDRLKSMRFEIDIQKPENWYRLADWARERGAFYKDKDLAAAAVDLDRLGVLTELRQLKPEDEQGFATLKQKAREKQLDPPLIQQITHDELQARFLNLRKKEFSEPAWKQLEEQIQQELLRTKKPLATFPSELNDKYLAAPREVYAAANSDERRTLGRLFLIETLLQRLLHQARPDGSNGFEIADQLQALTPERADLQKTYHDLAIAWNLKRIDVATRIQLDGLASRLEKLGRKDLAIAAKQKWLSVRESVFRQDGARGLADLAELWMSLLQDESKATRLMQEAWVENPQYTPATDWLTAHGYQLIEGKWLSEIEIAAMPEDPRKVAIREGRLEVGMTATDVHAAIGTPPTSMTRSVSRRQVTEWWVYKDSGILVQLVKGSRERESHVVSVEKLAKQKE